MARPLPVRTTADTNSPNDVNTLSSAIEDMIDGSTAFESITFQNTSSTAGLHTENSVLKYQGATIATGSNGGGVVTDAFIKRPSGSWDYPTAAPAPLDLISTTAEKVQLYDDTTEEFVISQDFLPPTIDTASRLVIHVHGKAKTPVASKNIALKFYYYAYNTGDDFSGAWNSLESGDLATDSTNTYDDYFTYGTTANVLNEKNFIRFKHSRIDASANDLVGDYRQKNWMLEIPRA